MDFNDSFRTRIFGATTTVWQPIECDRFQMVSRSREVRKPRAPSPIDLESSASQLLSYQRTLTHLHQPMYTPFYSCYIYIYTNTVTIYISIQYVYKRRNGLQLCHRRVAPGPSPSCTPSRPAGRVERRVRMQCVGVWLQRSSDFEKTCESKVTFWSWVMVLDPHFVACLTCLVYLNMTSKRN